MTRHAYDSLARCPACGERCRLSTPSGLRLGLVQARHEIEVLKRALLDEPEGLDPAECARDLAELRVEALEIASRLEWCP